MNSSALIVSVGTAGAVFAAERLTTEAGRAAVIAVVVLAVTALVRWVWNAIVNQLGTQLDTKIDALAVQLDSKMAEFTEQTKTRHDDANRRLLALERTRLDPAVLTHILSTLDTLSKQVGGMHNRAPTAPPSTGQEGTDR